MEMQSPAFCYAGMSPRHASSSLVVSMILGRVIFLLLLLLLLLLLRLALHCMLEDVQIYTWNVKTSMPRARTLVAFHSRT